VQIEIWFSKEKSRGDKEQEKYIQEIIQSNFLATIQLRSVTQAFLINFKVLKNEKHQS